MSAQALDRLISARRIAAELNHCKKERIVFAEDGITATACCAFGALQLAKWEDESCDSIGEPGQDAEARQAFRDAIGSWNISAWNDSPLVGKAEVVAGFDKAIAAMKSRAKRSAV